MGIGPSYVKYQFSGTPGPLSVPSGSDPVLSSIFLCSTIKKFGKEIHQPSEHVFVKWVQLIGNLLFLISRKSFVSYVKTCVNDIPFYEELAFGYVNGYHWKANSLNL